jgi:3-hydroxyacyl-[acyl-carrier-protein] dehydratase
MNFQNIIDKLPYTTPFLFVDELESVSEDKVEGFYTFKKDEFFYQGHFKDHPVTPGVILTECMAQIGLVCLGIHILLSENFSEESGIALSSSEMDFYIPVYPGEKVKVVSEKVFFRFNKLKCKVKMLNSKNEIVAKGTISGMMGLKK